MNVTFFNSITAKQPIEKSVEQILESIRSGEWQDSVLQYRNELAKVKDKKEVEHLKKKFPIFTASGIFKERKIEGLISHSGLILLDFDEIENPNEVKELLKNDRHIFAAFISCSGKGLAVMVKIVPEKHNDIFEPLCEYFLNTYSLVVDTSGRDVSRARFISYDPFLIHKPDSQKFDRVIKKKKVEKISNYIVPKTDFDSIISEINSRSIDICPNYYEWLRVGFALASEFGESGRNYFHIVSSQSSKYNSKNTDNQYNACVKAKGHGVTINTFYHYCKENNIRINSDTSLHIIQYAAVAKKARRDKDSAVKTFKEVEQNITPEVEEIFNLVYSTNAEIKVDTSDISKLETYLRQNYTFKRNLISRHIEINGENMIDNKFNTIFIDALKNFDEKLSDKKLKMLICSDFSTPYNPIKDFFAENINLKPQGLIKKLVSCIPTTTGFETNNFNGDFVEKFITKWLVSVVSSVYGEPSPLQLILSGSMQGTGKTMFFRNLLPEQLEPYYAESKLLEPKDDPILMTQKLIIMDDECSGKSKKDDLHLKELTSKKRFSLRVPFGHFNEDLVRLATLCGTSNNDDLLTDPTGNRRVIPIRVISKIDWEKYNSINKTELWMEIYHLWASGYEWRVLGEDIKELNECTQLFQAANMERELFLQYFRIPSADEIKNGNQAIEFFTTSRVKSHIEIESHSKLSLNKLGAEIKGLGVEKTIKRLNGSPTQGFYLVQL